MKTFLYLMTLAASSTLAVPASGQAAGGAGRNDRAIVDEVLTNLAADAVGAQARSLSDLRRDYAARGLEIDARGMAHVEIRSPWGTECRPDVVVADTGGRVTGKFMNYAEAWVPIARIDDLARVLPSDHVLANLNGPMDDDVEGQGPAVANSAAWRDAGSNGAGITIGVIDRGFTGWSAGQANGDLPLAPRAATISLVLDSNGNPLPFEAGSTHGTNCVEVVYDHCPQANYRVYRIDSPADVVTAVVDCVSNGVEIISMSQSFYNQGWDDDVGPVSVAAAYAANNGILFCTSAGNRRNQHWQGAFDFDGTSRWHDWGGGTRAMPITLPPGGGGHFNLAWDTSAFSADLDFGLYIDPNLTFLIASNHVTATNVYEDFWYYNNSATNSLTVYLAVENAGTVTPDIEVFFHSDNIDTCNGPGVFPAALRVEESSTTSPSNTSHFGVLSVAAVTQGAYGSPAGSNVSSCYSSIGPTNGFRAAPDVTGPTDVLTFTTGGFGGTSCATPNVAGIAGVLWSDNPSLDVTGVAHLMRQLARLEGDWGAPGYDDTYGEGGVHLIDYHPNTLFVDKLFGNALNNPTGPYSSVQAAHDAATSGGRLALMNGGLYIEPLSVTTPLTLSVFGLPATVRP